MTSPVDVEQRSAKQLFLGNSVDLPAPTAVEKVSVSSPMDVPLVDSDGPEDSFAPTQNDHPTASDVVSSSTEINSQEIGLGWETVGRKGRNASNDGESLTQSTPAADGASNVNSIENESSFQADAKGSMHASSISMSAALSTSELQTESAAALNHAVDRNMVSDSELTFDTQLSHQQEQVTEKLPVEVAPPTMAPWSNAASAPPANAGLSLREIQRQEELRAKEKASTIAATSVSTGVPATSADRDESSTIQAARTVGASGPTSRWNAGHPWGGAATTDVMKNRTLNLREQMRLEEERKKTAAAREQANAVAAASVTGNMNAGNVATKTGWASLVANSKPAQPVMNRPAATVVGRKMDEETSFWETVANVRGPGVGVANNVGGRSGTHGAGNVGRAGVGSAASISNHHQGSSSGVGARRGGVVGASVTGMGSGLASNKTNNNNNINMSDNKKNEHYHGHDAGHNMNNNNNNNKKGNNNSGGGKVRYSNEFTAWCIENLQKLTGTAVGDRTFVDYLVEMKSDAEIRDTILQNLGTSDDTRLFADEFVRRLDFERQSVVAEAGGNGAAGRKKGRKQRANNKVDPSLVLGFTSTSSRIMQGTIEMPEMK